MENFEVFKAIAERLKHLPQDDTAFCDAMTDSIDSLYSHHTYAETGEWVYPDEEEEWMMAEAIIRDLHDKAQAQG